MTLVLKLQCDAKQSSPLKLFAVFSVAVFEFYFEIS